MKKLASITAVLMLLVITGCPGGSGGFDPSNVLLGKWKLVPDAVHSPYCGSTMEFTAKTYSAPDAQGKVSTIPVTYVTGNPKTLTFPTTVYVLTDAGITFHTTYNFTDKDHMKLDSVGMCSYARQ